MMSRQLCHAVAHTHTHTLVHIILKGSSDEPTEIHPAVKVNGYIAKGMYTSFAAFLYNNRGNEGTSLLDGCILQFLK